MQEYLRQVLGSDVEQLEGGPPVPDWGEDGAEYLSRE
jgi:hypothetical protein